jgi:hypothetical protein
MQLSFPTRRLPVYCATSNDVLASFSKSRIADNAIRPCRKLESGVLHTLARGVSVAAFSDVIES